MGNACCSTEAENKPIKVQTEAEVAETMSYVQTLKFDDTKIPKEISFAVIKHLSANYPEVDRNDEKQLVIYQTTTE